MKSAMAISQSSTIGISFLFSLFCFAVTNGQKISFQGQVGCAVIAPEAPEHLRAFPGLGKVRLTWKAPKNNACVDEYVVDVKHISNRNRHFVEPRKHVEKVKKYQTTIEGLENGEMYEFSVRAISHEFDDHRAKASVKASPRNVCRQKRPGRVKNLRATPGDGHVEVCWDGVDNDACVSEYKVRTRVKTDYYRHHYDYPEEISKGGCVKIKELSNNVKYEFSIIGYHQHAGIGIPTYIVSSPKLRPKKRPHHDHYHYHLDEEAEPYGTYSGVCGLHGCSCEGNYGHDTWTCHSIQHSYPRCQAAKWKRCKQMSCAAHATAGNCDAPFMQKVDHEKKVITQYCSGYCPCPRTPSPKSENRILFLDDYCCKKHNVSYKIKRPF